jgi:hypothetical protein
MCSRLGFTFAFGGSYLATIAPEDEAANKVILSGLSSQHPKVVETAARVLRNLKYGRLGIKQLTLLAQSKTSQARLEAIQSLVALADDANEKTISKLLHD